MQDKGGIGKEKQNMNDVIDFVIDKLIELRIKAEFEDKQRGKKRYVTKTSAYNDLIKLLKEYYE